jgi:hypothetical protein
VGQITRNVNSGLLFVLVQTLLYGAFLTLDLTGNSINLSNAIKFSVIILCFCYALYYRKSANKSIVFCLRAALFFTVISDLFILILDYNFYGVLTFILVQQLYGMRLIMVQRVAVKEGVDSLILRTFCVRLIFEVGIAGIVCIILQHLGVVMDRLLIASVFYFICILINVITAVRATFKSSRVKGEIIFALGMFLFLLCDINVGLFNLSGFLPMPESLYKVIYSYSSILMWTFYAPAQVLIALSVRQSK